MSAAELRAEKLEDGDPMCTRESGQASMDAPCHPCPGRGTLFGDAGARPALVPTKCCPLGGLLGTFP